jgi:hypothetical protein
VTVISMQVPVDSVQPLKSHFPTLTPLSTGGQALGSTVFAVHVRVLQVVVPVVTAML